MRVAQTILAAFRRRSALASAYTTLYRMPEGKMVIDDLLRKAGLLEVSHVIGDPSTTAFRDGRRSMGLEVLDAMRWTEGELVKLAQEQTAERLNAAAEQFEMENV